MAALKNGETDTENHSLPEESQQQKSIAGARTGRNT